MATDIFGDYQEVDDGEDDDGPEAAEVGVGEEGADEGRDVAGAAPVGDIVGRGGGVLVQLEAQVRHHVGGDPIVRQALTTLLRCGTCPTIQELLISIS